MTKAGCFDKLSMTQKRKNLDPVTAQSSVGRNDIYKETRVFQDDKKGKILHVAQHDRKKRIKEY